MSNTLVRVIAQYYDENGKAKGGQEFTFRADSDLFMYCPQEILASAIQSMIDLETKRYGGRYEYREHELVFHEPIQLQANFELALDQASLNEARLAVDKQYNDLIKQETLKNPIK